MRFVHHHKLTYKTKITIATKTTQMTLQLNLDNSVTVDFDLPNLKPVNIPFLMSAQAAQYELPLQKGSVTIHALSVGNPHAISCVENLADIPIETLGKEISEHPLFPQQTNVSFMTLLDKNRIALRVYERGCGETQACGSAAVAAAAVARLFYQLESPIEVSLPGGKLVVEWPTITQPISLTGPASFIYEGIISDNFTADVEKI